MVITWNDIAGLAVLLGWIGLWTAVMIIFGG